MPTPVDPCAERCSPACSEVFTRVQVWPSFRFGAWVDWTLSPYFAGPAPHTFQLQVGHTGSNTADDWEDVGAAAQDVTGLGDDERRDFGTVPYTHYRVKLTDADSGIYYSTPQNVWGTLTHRSWRLALNRERVWRRQLERSIAGREGYLLKRKIVGTTPAPGHGVVDFLTGEVSNPQAQATVGTEFLGGYYTPISCIFGGLEPISRYEHVQSEGGKGTTNEGNTTTGRFIAVPQIDTRDIWVDLTNDFRWEFGQIKHLEELQGVPVALTAKMHLLPFTHIAYTVAMPGQ